ncbi:MAG: proton-conducting membrane transporter [Alphaproteobacteria bacterium CG_4_10_14_0_2_um_filter_63_37]|nr:MAG: hypothetical protein AUJ55_08740 [Proteobacteria bacterium CG1_02_64_396]PJA23883.1 MAG: proton-conducting membrane transporter [Alphaproteobacteria bacterium CG_4_10_14_0_2_um_filter_63_37]
MSDAHPSGRTVRLHAGIFSYSIDAGWRDFMMVTIIPPSAIFPTLHRPHPDQPMSQQVQRLSLVLFSGSYDRILFAFVLASAGAAIGMRVSIFATFWGLNAVRRPGVEPLAPSGEADLEQALRHLNRPGLEDLPLSDPRLAAFNGGDLKALVERKGTAQLDELLEICLELGVKITACEMAMVLLGIGKDELIEGVDADSGAVSFLSEARSEGALTFFI